MCGSAGFMGWRHFLVPRQFVHSSQSGLIVSIENLMYKTGPHSVSPFYSYVKGIASSHCLRLHLGARKIAKVVNPISKFLSV